jgi:hypothetical protein
MSSTLFIFSQDEHSLTLPIVAELIEKNNYFDKYVVILIDDSFSIARILKNFIFFGLLPFIKVINQNLFKKIKLNKINCQPIWMSQSEFRRCQWFNLLTGNYFGLSINCPIKISEEILKKFDGKILNVHNSLLPRYGGLMPVLRQVNEQDFCFGSTIHHINKNLDEGQILYQFCLMRSRFISPYQIWSNANLINQSLLSVLSPKDYRHATPMDLSVKSYYSIPTWREVFLFWIHKCIQNILGIFR